MNILICYDETNASQAALKLGLQHAKAFDAKVYVITSLMGGNRDGLEDNKIAERGLEHAQKILEKEGISYETHLLVRGLSSGEDILLFASEKKVDEIIIGIKRISKLGKFVFGSTAQLVILHSICPVVTVK